MSVITDLPCDEINDVLSDETIEKGGGDTVPQLVSEETAAPTLAVKRAAKFENVMDDVVASRSLPSDVPPFGIVSLGRRNRCVTEPGNRDLEAIKAQVPDLMLKAEIIELYSDSPWSYSDDHRSIASYPNIACQAVGSKMNGPVVLDKDKMILEVGAMTPSSRGVVPRVTCLPVIPTAALGGVPL